jgi:fructose 1,6-bisphosphatase
MIAKQLSGYVLLLSYDPCDIFNYYNVTEMHGLSLAECESHSNMKDDSYIAGWSNFDPHDANKRFVFINLSRCNGIVETVGLVMHEMMHHSFWLHDYDIEKEEEIITWAEKETYEAIKLIDEAKKN